MSRVHIVTDSTVDLPARVAATFGISIVPLKVIFGQDVMRDGIDLTNEEFYRRLVSEKASTSQPSPADFLDVYRRLTTNGDSVISLHISAQLSGTFQSANIARSMLPNASIDVLDTRLTSIALALIAIVAAQAAESGTDHITVLNLCHRLIDSTQVYFMVDTLDYLQRGGRIGGAQAFLGSILSIKPILRLQDGVISAVDKVRGRAKGIDTLVRLVNEERRSHGNLRYGIVWGNDQALRDQFLAQTRDAFKEPPYAIVQAGAIIGSHVGPGVIGIGFHPATAVR